MTPVQHATAALFTRYAEFIEAARAEAPDLLAADARLSLENLLWICREGAARIEELPEDKTSRWLGFVQGCLAMRQIIDVDEERNVSRPLFHEAYRASQIPRPPTVARAG